MNAPRAEPSYFGPGTRPCFGWLHRAAPDAGAPRLGLVVCNPFGYEAVSSQRSLRHFAEAAAGAGVPALRFDYDGTGDSAGDDRDPGRWQAWQGSIHRAVEWLRGTTGVERVCLLGVRLGASLATLTATQRDDVAGLVAIAPVWSGKAWLRELRVLETMTGFPPPPSGFETVAGDQEAIGFVLTAETQASIGKLDLLAVDRRPAPDVLILDRDDLPPDPRFAERLRLRETRVEHRRVPGYAGMMLDAHDAVVPSEMIREVSAWLAQRLVSAPDPVTPIPSVAGASAAVAPGVLETAVFLDDSRTLFGIMAKPASSGGPTRAILLINSGAILHTGPSRQYVRLARRWAARGAMVLRFDVAGIGDSPPWPGDPENVVYSPRAVADVGIAATWLREHQHASTLQAVGLCSGAYHGFKAAVAGAPLESVAIVNPLVFFWKAGMSLAYPTYQVSEATARYKRSIFQFAKWKKLLAGRVNLGAIARVLGHRAAQVGAGFLRNLARGLGWPLAEDLGAELVAVAGRGVALRFVFSSGDPGEDLLRLGSGWALPPLLRDDRARIQRIAGPDHSFTPVWSQAALATALERALGLP